MKNEFTIIASLTAIILSSLSLLRRYEVISPSLLLSGVMATSVFLVISIVSLVYVHIEKERVRKK